LLRRSVFIVEKKLSIAALSQQFPQRLMLQTMPSFDTSGLHQARYAVLAVRQTNINRVSNNAR
jgi:hypothetical protein